MTDDIRDRARDLADGLDDRARNALALVPRREAREIARLLRRLADDAPPAEPGTYTLAVTPYGWRWRRREAPDPSEQPSEQPSESAAKPSDPAPAVMVPHGHRITVMVPPGHRITTRDGVLHVGKAADTPAAHRAAMAGAQGNPGETPAAAFERRVDAAWSALVERGDTPNAAAIAIALRAADAADTRRLALERVADAARRYHRERGFACGPEHDPGPGAELAAALAALDGEARR